MPSRLHTVRLFFTETGAVVALAVSIAITFADLILKAPCQFHNLGMAISLFLIGAALFSICFRGCAISDNHHWRMFMGIIFVLWGIGFILPGGIVSLEFNDFITVLFVIDIFLIIYDNSTVILKGSRSCKIEKKCEK